MDVEPVIVVNQQYASKADAPKVSAFDRIDTVYGLGYRWRAET